MEELLNCLQDLQGNLGKILNSGIFKNLNSNTLILTFRAILHNYMAIKDTIEARAGQKLLYFLMDTSDLYNMK